MSIIIDTLEKINTKWNKKSFTITRTYYMRPRFFLAGFIYCAGYLLLFIFLTEFTNFFEVLFSPLSILQPALRPFIEPDVTLVGWIIILVALGIIFIGFFAGFVPGVILIVKSSDLIDKEWPDDEEKTKQWREDYAKRKNVSKKD